MVCLYCKHPATDVKNSRPHKKTAHVWRRRHCTQCLQSFTTDERPRLETLLKISQAGTTHPFNRGILITSITDAFRHDTEKGRRIAWDLSETVIDKLTQSGSPDIDSAAIRIICHDVIRRYDRAAGTQYAIAHQLPF
jgi:transcriptional repressor NrdR